MNPAAVHGTPAFHDSSEIPRKSALPLNPCIERRLCATLAGSPAHDLRINYRSDEVVRGDLPSRNPYLSMNSNEDPGPRALGHTSPRAQSLPDESSIATSSRHARALLLDFCYCMGLPSGESLLLLAPFSICASSCHHIGQPRSPSCPKRSILKTSIACVKRVRSVFKTVRRFFAEQTLSRHSL